MKLSEHRFPVEGIPELDFGQALGLGVQLQKAGEFKSAQDIYEALLSHDPHHSEALHLKATLEHSQHNHAAALEFYHRAIAADPNLAANHFNVGLVRLAMFNPDAAIVAFHKASTLAPHDPRCYDGLGYAFRLKGQFADAAKCYTQGLICDPCSISLILNFASTLHSARYAPDQKSGIAEALRTLSRFVTLTEQQGIAQLGPSVRLSNIAATLHKNYVYHYSLGLLFGLVGDGHKAAIQFDHASALMPERAEAFLCLGKMLMQLKRTQEAVETYLLALQIEPYNRDALFTLAYLYGFQGENEKALELLSPVLDTEVLTPQSQFSLGLLYMSQGEYLKGFKAHESRRQFVWSPRDDALPYWNGESLAGKKILLTCEQGYGDCFQFVRYAQVLTNLGAQVHLWAYPPLVAIFQSIPNVTVYQEDQPFADTLDLQCPLPSIPYFLNQTLANLHAEVPYLSANPERLRKLDLGPRTKTLRVGICWAGNVAHALDAVRSCPLSEFRTLFEVENCAFFSFQKGNNNFGSFADVLTENVVDVEPHISDFADTAALLVQMDLIVTVDSGVAHLAGALGVPTWILLPKEGVDWRWQQKRNDSAWYPSVRLFRQNTQDDWAEVLQRVKKVLRG